MKKTLLSALLSTTVVLAANTNYTYEVTPLYGYSIETEISEDEGFEHYGFTIARNFKDSFINQLELGFLRREDISYENSNLSTDVNRYYTNVIKDLPLNESFTAYGLLGLGYQNFTNNTYNKDSAFINYGLGVKYNIRDNIAIKTDIRHIVPGKDDAILFTIGLGLSFREFPTSQQPVKRTVARDSDGDGVINKLDHCPNTKPGMKVNASGCEIDSDNDGIVDSLDHCPNTKPSVKVNANGCELDSDNDGVVDSLDHCPGTAADVQVNINGCEIDSDNDGVVDSLDQCPDTAANVQVNINGCELDSDSDGIINSLDKCPNSIPGSKVNAEGCDDGEEIELKINFDSRSSQIREQDVVEVEALAGFLNNELQQNIIIEAHTDSKGSQKYNLKLSEERANSVKESLVALGVEASRIETYGVGEIRPIATNETAEGREENRRITIILK